MKSDRLSLWLLLAVALTIRLLSLGAYPLMDTTEARYGEMARLMVETGNWLTPQFDYGIPFWGKPPLFSWMSAAGIKLLGVSELAVRLPHWLAGILVIILMAWFARRLGTSGLASAVVLASSIGFAVFAGTVMTDMALTLGMTLAMIGFYLCWRGERLWGYVGFAGLGLGLLAKGPLIIVLMGMAVMPWLFLQHGFKGGFKELWRRFPLLQGGFLMLAIALPWYLLAEAATPGFLDYFIVGEHFKRFLISGWEGDLYGTAHREAYGTIWFFWLLAAIPWSFVLPVLLWKQRRKLIRHSAEHQTLSFLLLWMLSPMLLFTLSGNILPAYVLPGIPALGVLITMLLGPKSTKKLWFLALAVMAPLLLSLALVDIDAGTGERNSDKRLLTQIQPDLPTYYIGFRPFSGQFYSEGKATLLESNAALASLPQVQLIGKANHVDPIIKHYQLSCVVEYTAKSGRSLYRCHNPNESTHDEMPKWQDGF